jgi:hypothetical protein
LLAAISGNIKHSKAGQGHDAVKFMVEASRPSTKVAEIGSSYQQQHKQNMSLRDTKAIDSRAFSKQQNPMRIKKNRPPAFV